MLYVVFRKELMYELKTGTIRPVSNLSIASRANRSDICALNQQMLLLHAAAENLQMNATPAQFYAVRYAVCCMLYVCVFVCENEWERVYFWFRISSNALMLAFIFCLVFGSGELKLAYKLRSWKAKARRPNWVLAWFFRDHASSLVEFVCVMCVAYFFDVVPYCFAGIIFCCCCCCCLSVCLSVWFNSWSWPMAQCCSHFTIIDSMVDVLRSLPASRALFLSMVSVCTSTQKWCMTYIDIVFADAIVYNIWNNIKIFWIHIAHHTKEYKLIYMCIGIYSFAVCDCSVIYEFWERHNALLNRKFPFLRRVRARLDASVSQIPYFGKCFKRTYKTMSHHNAFYCLLPKEAHKKHRLSSTHKYILCGATQLHCEQENNEHEIGAALSCRGMAWLCCCCCCCYLFSGRKSRSNTVLGLLCHYFLSTSNCDGTIGQTEHMQPKQLGIFGWFEWIIVAET